MHDPLHVNSPLIALGPIAVRYRAPLHTAGISSIRDLLFYYPYRYEDWSCLTPIAVLVPGSEATIRGTLSSITAVRVPWRPTPNIEARITDAEGNTAGARWYHSPFLLKSLTPGMHLIISGKVERVRGESVFIHPQWEKIADLGHPPRAALMPVYHLTGALTQKILRTLVMLALSRIPRIPDHLSSWIVTEAKLISLERALRDIHLPHNWSAQRPAEQRLKFDELFFLQLRGARARRNIIQLPGVPLAFNQTAIQNFVHSLPFSLTHAQKKAAWDIIQDMGRAYPMNRLLEGDVGSGKTAVAAIGALHAVHAGAQVAYLAPTSILAVQHFKTFCTLFAATSIRIALLTQGDTRLRQIQNTRSKTQNKDEKIIKKELLALLAQKKIDIVIGTHALLAESVQMHALALVIVDEQHRFGVRQRHGLLQNKEGKVPHYLSMTATPIPRSLALVAYGDLDLSLLDEMPKGRAEIVTSIVAPHQRPDAYAHIHKEIAKGRQAFIICPLIDPSDTLGVKSVREESARLRREHFPRARLAELHGRMRAQEKDHVMREFSAGTIDVLVATPVVEVGIDVPNATVILIEAAERFGLAQLHQLRGRVGRSVYHSHCLLATDTESENAIARLHAVVSSRDGFALAEKDLAMRGPGDAYGTAQSGFVDNLKIAKLTDAILLAQSQKAVTRLLRHDPDLKDYPAITARLLQFEESVHLE